MQNNYINKQQREADLDRPTGKEETEVVLSMSDVLRGLNAAIDAMWNDQFRQRNYFKHERNIIKWQRLSQKVLEEKESTRLEEKINYVGTVCEKHEYISCEIISTDTTAVKVMWQCKNCGCLMPAENQPQEEKKGESANDLINAYHKHKMPHISFTQEIYSREEVVDIIRYAQQQLQPLPVTNFLDEETLLKFPVGGILQIVLRYLKTESFPALIEELQKYLPVSIELTELESICKTVATFAIEGCYVEEGNFRVNTQFIQSRIEKYLATVTLSTPVLTDKELEDESKVIYPYPNESEWEGVNQIRKSDIDKQREAHIRARKMGVMDNTKAGEIFDKGVEIACQMANDGHINPFQKNILNQHKETFLNQFK